ncbi:MAG: hypothetical protein HFJ30_00665 [Clostridia bacterium]|nr:hypothetical protein [Clostridia bacterium]
MNTTQTYVKMPVIGKVQHGEKLITDDGKQRTVDYGYFIAKIQEANMQQYLDKFNTLIKGSKSIDIQFLDDNPLSVRQERANQSGTVCYCMEGQSKGKQKIKNLWQDIECKSDCTYLQKDTYGKSPCKRIAWLKFLIPQIALDRIWLMKITGQEAIDNLQSYISFQYLQGNSLKNNIYTIFLTQKEQIDSLGKIHNNYVLDIIQKSDFISHPPISNNSQDPQKPIINNDKTPTNTTQKTSKQSNSSKEKQSQGTTTTTKSSSTPVKKEEKKETTSQKSASKKETTSKPKSSNQKKAEESNQETTSEYDNCYVLLSTSTEKIQNKEYFVAEFVDMQDKTLKVAIHPNFVTELSECELGTVVKLDIQEVQQTNFAVGLEFVEKHTKKVAA